eukprot:CFRG7423T1
MTVCKFWAQGNCNRGNACKFEHVGPSGGGGGFGQQHNNGFNNTSSYRRGGGGGLDNNPIIMPVMASTLGIEGVTIAIGVQK